MARGHILGPAGLRVAALLVLLLAAGELVSCELLGCDGCQITTSGDSGDECLCCCTTPIPTAPIAFAPAELVWYRPPQVDPRVPVSRPDRIYHPPRLCSAAVWS
ncbi:MAG: hypothetical protein AAB225_21715 [Acidobacteriota bacterium]